MIGKSLGLYRYSKSTACLSEGVPCSEYLEKDRNDELTSLELLDW